MKPDVIILGGGIIGCSLGFALARRGARPVIVEPDRIGGASTSASFAWANATSKTANAAYHRLNAAGVAGYRTLADQFPEIAAALAQTGSLQIATRDQAHEAGALMRDAGALQRLGHACEHLERGELAALEPDLALPRGATGLYCPQDLIIDAPAFTRAICARMQAAGGQLVQTRPGALIADDDGRVRGVETGAGPIHAATIVTAAGRDTGALLASLTGFAPFASRFPLREVPGFLLTTPPSPAAAPRRVVFTPVGTEFHMLPSPAGGIRMGSDDIDALIWDDRSPAAMHRAARALLTRGERFLPGLAQRVAPADCQLQIGLRPMPEDGLSIAGPLPGARGLFVIATHSGITLAPVLGQAMADWITTGTRPDILAPYGLDRFAGFAA